MRDRVYRMDRLGGSGAVDGLLEGLCELGRHQQEVPHQGTERSIGRGSEFPLRALSFGRGLIGVHDDEVDPSADQDPKRSNDLDERLLAQSNELAAGFLLEPDLVLVAEEEDAGEAHDAGGTKA